MLEEACGLGGYVGGAVELASRVLSAFTPRASQTSHVQLWPRGLGQEARRWSKHIWNVMGTLSLVRLCVLCVCLCWEAMANRRPAVIQCGRPFHDPSHQNPSSFHHLTPLLPHPIAPFGHACPHAAPSAKCTHKTCARTGTSTHMASIKQGCMDPL